MHWGNKSKWSHHRNKPNLWIILQELLQELCAPCIEDGWISIFLSVRICKRCIAQVRQCIRRAVLVITTDCEGGNKQIFLSLKNKIETERTDPELLLAVPLPNAPHLGKIFKASFSNWILKLFNERRMLGFSSHPKEQINPGWNGWNEKSDTKKWLCKKQGSARPNCSIETIRW